MPRSLSIPSKNPISINRKYIPGGNDGRPQPLVVELPAPTLAEPIKIGFLQQLVQPPVERVSGRLGQLCPIPQRLLSLTMLARSHGHGPIVSKNISEVTCFFPIW